MSLINLHSTTKIISIVDSRLTASNLEYITSITNEIDFPSFANDFSQMLLGSSLCSHCFPKYLLTLPFLFLSKCVTFNKIDLYVQ